MMTGFRLIRVVGPDDYVTVYFAHGMIEHAPKIRYRVEKRNAFDPSYIHRAKPYHEDTFKLRTPISPRAYDRLLLFLESGGEVLLEYEHQGCRMKQFPVVIEDLPSCADDLHEWPGEIEMKAVSRYVDSPPAMMMFPGPATPTTLIGITDHNGGAILDHNGEAILAYVEDTEAS